MLKHTPLVLNLCHLLFRRVQILLAAVLCAVTFSSHAEAIPRAAEPVQAISADIYPAQFRNRGWGRSRSYAPIPRYNAPAPRISPNRQRYDQLRANQQQRFRAFQAARQRYNELLGQRRQRIQALQLRRQQLNAQRMQRANDQKRLQNQKQHADRTRNQEQKDKQSGGQIATAPGGSGNRSALNPRLQSRLNRVSAKALAPRLSAGTNATGAGGSGSSGNGSRPPEAGASSSSGSNSRPPASRSENGGAGSDGGGGGKSGDGGPPEKSVGLSETFNREVGRQSDSLVRTARQISSSLPARLVARSDTTDAGKTPSSSFSNAPEAIGAATNLHFRRAVSERFLATKDDYTFKGSIRNDPRAIVRFENKSGHIVVTDINRGDLPRGSAGTFLANTLKAHNFVPKSRLSFSNIIEPNTVTAFRDKADPASSTLGRTAVNMSNELGLKIKSMQFRQEGSKIHLDVEFEE